MKALILCCFLFISCNKNNHQDVLTQKVENLKKFNETEKKKFYELENGLKVLLVSTSNIKKSMVSLSVKVGSASDPVGQEGMAHFLEHMLFLGTKKYPQVGDYQEFFTSHQGSFNAYTATENTNYHFEIPHEHLVAAIDRFSQFFISPNFDKEYLKREKNAVNSEHQKNLLDDGRRYYRIKKLMLPKDHLVRKFSTGNNETLKEITQEDVIKFYQGHYSSNLMNLVIYSPLPLAELEKIAKEYFLPIENRKLKEPQFEMVKPYEKARVVQIQSQTQMQRLALDFSVPAQNEKYWKSKPLFIIGHLIGHEAEGSLLSLLKEENLAFSLSAGAHESSFQNTFGINIALTDKGLKNIDKVINMTFNYIHLLKESSLKDYIYNELDITQRLEYVYGSKEVSLSDVSGTADYLFEYPYVDIEKRASLLYQKPQKEYLEFLNSLKPENLTVYLQHPHAQTDQKEQYYQINYSVEEVKKEIEEKWLEVKKLALALPKPNSYIPEDLSLKQDEESKYPKKILDNELGLFYFQQNDQLLYPNAITNLRFLIHKKYLTPNYQIIMSLYLSALADTLNEWKYMADIAGLKFQVSSFSRGIEIQISGFSDKSPLLLEDLIKKLKTIELSQERFETYLAEMKKEFDNFELAPAYHQAGYWLKYLINKHSFTNSELKSSLSKVKKEDVFQFANDVFQEISIEGLTYGNLNSKEIKPIIKNIHQTLGAKVLAKENFINDEDVNFSPGLHEFNFFSKGNNNAWYGHFQLGEREIVLNSYLRVLSAIIDSEFYSQMRTNQQLGYIVHSGYNYLSKSYGYDFLIQSSKYPSKELRKRALAWIQTEVPKLIDNTNEEKFEHIKKVIHSQISQPVRSMKERMIWLQTQAFILNGDFDYKEKFAAQVLKVKKEDFKKTVIEKIIQTPTEVSISVGNNLKTTTNFQEVKNQFPTFK